MSELTPQQVEFCKYRADGTMGKADAYLKAYPNAKRSSAAVLARRLEHKPEIQAEIERLQKATETPLVLSRREKREFLASVVRCDARTLDEDSPLVESVTRYYDKDGNHTRTVLKIPSKNQAIEIDNKMAGHNEPDEVHILGGGGVMIVPANSNWEEAARKQQEELQQSVSEE